MSSKTLIVGDIHGCYTELLDLLDKAGIGANDTIISVGDFVDRGTDSRAVLNYIRDTANVKAIMGNHERKHVHSWHGDVPPAKSQIITRYQIGEEAYPDAITFMKGLPLYLDLPEALIVHGFFEPGLDITAQRSNVIVGTLSGELYLNNKYRAPWYTLYDGDKPLVVGHRNYMGSRHPLIVPGKVYGLDTGCVYGGALTGLILPDFDMVSVPARADHWANVKREYRTLGIIGDGDD